MEKLSKKLWICLIVTTLLDLVAVTASSTFIGGIITAAVVMALYTGIVAIDCVKAKYIRE